MSIPFERCDSSNIAAKMREADRKRNFEPIFDSLIRQWKDFSAKNHEGAMLDVTLDVKPEYIEDLNILLKDKGLHLLPAEGSFMSTPFRGASVVEYKLTAL